MSSQWNIWVSFKWNANENTDWDQWWNEIKQWKGPWGNILEAWCTTGDWDGWFKLDTTDPEVAKAFVSKLLADKRVANSCTHWWYKAA